MEKAFFPKFIGRKRRYHLHVTQSELHMFLPCFSYRGIWNALQVITIRNTLIGFHHASVVGVHVSAESFINSFRYLSHSFILAAFKNADDCISDLLARHLVCLSIKVAIDGAFKETLDKVFHVS